jgi:Tol biopolymer transport system component
MTKGGTPLRFGQASIPTAGLCVLLAASPLGAASYDFVPIYQLSPVEGVDGAPSLNNLGDVVFVLGYNPPVSHVLVTGSGGPIRTLASGTYDPTPHSLFTFHRPVVNDAGAVALGVRYHDATGFSFVDGLFILPPGGATPAVLVTDLTPLIASGVACLHCFDFNNAGQVAYLDGSGGPLTLFSGGVGSVISGSVGTIGTMVSLNDAGVALAPGGPANAGLYLFRSGQPPTLLASLGTLGGLYPSGLNTNDAAVSRDPLGNIQLIDGATVTPLVTSAQLPGPHISEPSFNDVGQVAFTAGATPIDDQILYVASSGQLTRVIGPGDALFGSVVTRIGVFLENSLNDVGQIAFAVSLQNGTVVIVRADPTAADLRVSITGAGTGTVTSVSAGIACPPDCDESYPLGTMVTLTASPAEGSTFGGFGGHPDCADNVVTMSALRGCTATFLPLTATPVRTVSRGIGGVPTDGASNAPVISADGRYAVFASRATNLVAAGCVTGESEVFRVDQTTGLTECVSQTVDGAPGDGPSGDPVVSADGRYVAYPTRAQNLAEGCANGLDQIVRTDMATRETVCVSRGPEGAGNAASRTPTMSGNGGLIAFVTPADNLDEACVNGLDQIQLRDLAAGTTRCLSVDGAGQAGTGPSVDPALSGDGTRLVFATQATNLLFGGGVAAAGASRERAPDGGPGPTAQREPLSQIMRRSTAVGAAVAELMSQSPGGALGNAESRRPVVSDDGETVAFQSTATNLVSECATGVSQVMVTGPDGMRCASRDEAGAPGDAPSTQPAISGAGTLVVFVSLAQNLTRGTALPRDISQIMRRSLAAQNAVVELLTQANGSAGDGASQRPSIDRAGQLTVFQSSATNLVSGDTNGQDDVLVVAIPLAPPATPDRVTITAPANGTVLPLTASTPLTVTWTAATGADQYALEFTGADRVFANPNSTAADGVNGLGGAGGAVVVPDTSFAVVLDPSFPAGLYQVRVVGLTAGFQPVGRFSDAITLSLGAVPPGNGRVRITQPAAGNVLTPGTPVTFVWEALPAVASYFFEFTGPGGQFANPNGTGPDTTNLTGGGFIVGTTGFTGPVPPLPPGVYQVRVIGRTAAGAFVGTFSDALSLTIQ